MHRIRLGSAWRLHVRPNNAVAAGANVDASRSAIELPARGELLLGNPDHGVIELRRSFNLPSNLADDQRVMLVFSGLAAGARIVLNNSLLGESFSGSSTGNAVSFEIQDKLRPRNELAIEFLNCGSIRPDATILDSVTLEIE